MKQTILAVPTIMTAMTVMTVMTVMLVGCGTKEDGFRNIATNDISAWNFAGNVDVSPENFSLRDSSASAAIMSIYKNFILEFDCIPYQGMGAVLFHTDMYADKAKGYEVLINNQLVDYQRRYSLQISPDPKSTYTDYERAALQKMGYTVGKYKEVANKRTRQEWRKSGSLSGVRNIAKRSSDAAAVGTKTHFRIEVADKNIKVYVDGLFVVDYTEPQRPYRLPQYEGRRLSEGVIAFVNYSNEQLEFSNVRIKTLPRDLVCRRAAQYEQDEQNDGLIRLAQQNFPLIDAHLHLKGGLTAADVDTMTRKYGITYGVAPNCGKGFPITNDQQVKHWLDSLKGHLFLLPMQAEGREWKYMFTGSAVEGFAYIFTDALTWTDHKGRRMRLWIPEETFVDDKQQFMDTLVARTCEIISTESVNIYANPTFLPQQLQPEYDALWTQARMLKVIDACVSNQIAIEINCRYRIPSARFIALAKERGAIFSIGTNNAGKHDVGKLEYALEIIAKCGLTADDMWIPVESWGAIRHGWRNWYKHKY
jgi:hypothetical protein